MAWTETTRENYRREGRRYASDLTDTEWDFVPPLTTAPSRIGRPCEVDLREILNAILYMASTGCQWRQLPKEFPPFTTVQGYFYAWSREGRSATTDHILVMAARRKAGDIQERDGGLDVLASFRSTQGRAISYCDT